MVHNLEINSELFEKLKSLARPFEENAPIDIIRRLVEDALSQDMTNHRLMNGIVGKWQQPSPKRPITTRRKYRDGVVQPNKGLCFPNGWMVVGTGSTLERTYAVCANPNRTTIHIDRVVPITSSPADAKKYHLDTLVLWRGKSMYYDDAEEMAFDIIERLLKFEKPQKIVSSLS